MTSEDHQSENNSCLNCGGRLESNYCAQCGQSRDIHRSLGAIWHDFSHGVLHFEGKFWRTLPKLVFKPGVLTRDYIAGKRAQYISPMALFLFSIFMMFAVFSFIGPSNITDNSDGFDFNTRDIMREFNDKNSEEIAKQISETQSAIYSGKSVDDEGNNLEDKLKGLKLAANVATGVKGDALPYLNVGNNDLISSDDSDIDDGSDRGDDSDIDTGVEWLDQSLKDADANPILLLYKMKANGYKFAWLLIPLSIPFVWFSMLGLRGYHIYDHAIFTIYSISFMSLLFILLAILVTFGVSLGWLIPALLIVPFVHLYKQIKYAYQLSRFQTIVRLIILFFGILITLLLFFTILLTLGILS